MELFEIIKLNESGMYDTKFEGLNKNLLKETKLRELSKMFQRTTANMSSILRDILADVEILSNFDEEVEEFYTQVYNIFFKSGKRAPSKMDGFIKNAYGDIMDEMVDGKLYMTFEEFFEGVFEYSQTLNDLRSNIEEFTYVSEDLDDMLN